jgi:hypothetical protein
MSGKKHYVDNKKFYAAICDYKVMVKEAQEAGKPKPQIPRYIAECFLLLAKNIGTKPNFSKYPGLEDMMSDGVENCVHYFDNFDTERYSNPYGYFTQIIHFAFFRRIQKEKHQLRLKYKLLERSVIFDEIADQGEYDDTFVLEGHGLDNEKMIDIVKGIENWEAKRRAKKKSKGLDNFIEEENHGEDQPYYSDDHQGLGEEFEGPDSFEDD